MPERILIDTLSHTHIIFDACCIINMDATTYLEEMLQSLTKPAFLAGYVASRELRRLTFQPLIEKGQLTITDVMTEQEKLDWFSYAFDYDLEEGEAITGAIARSRGWIIATDEWKAIDAFQHTIPNVAVISTPDIVRHWADRTNPPIFTLRQALDDIQHKGNYYPGARHPLHNWWKAISPPRHFTRRKR